MEIGMKKVKLLVPVLMFIFVGNALVFASTVKEPNYTPDMTDEELAKEYQKSYLGEHPLCRKYLYDVLYVGMPEEEFISKFTKNATYEGTARPYIFKETKNVYYITFPNLPYLRDDINLISRITFKDRLLIKMEDRYLSKPPFMWYVYGDITNSLMRKEGNNLALPENAAQFDSMYEDEFVNKVASDTFFTIINKENRPSGNIYIIQGKDGKKWRLKFYPEGGLFRRECLR